MHGKNPNCQQHNFILQGKKVLAIVLNALIPEVTVLPPIFPYKGFFDNVSQMHLEKEIQPN